MNKQDYIYKCNVHENWVIICFFYMFPQFENITISPHKIPPATEGLEP